jgi:hypothetical protein
MYEYKTRALRARTKVSGENARLYTLRTSKILAWRVAIFYNGQGAYGYRHVPKEGIERGNIIAYLLGFKTPPEGTNSEEAGGLYSTVGILHTPPQNRRPLF